MPLWNIYHPPTAFKTVEEKKALAEAITTIYTAVPLPAFYVNVLFHQVEPDSYYIGAIQRPSPNADANGLGATSSVPWIRITIQNIARKLETVEVRDRFLGRVDKALKPHIEDKGYDWEYSVEETSRDLWKMNGLVPPKPGTMAEKEWDRLNKAVPFEAKDGGLE